METQLNSSVYELYMRPNSDADVDILFFHGLHTRSNKGAYLSTWRSRDERKSVWPREWLPEEYPNARVLTISYDGDLNKYDEGGRMDLHLVAESLLADLLMARVGQTRPAILVGHSFGGLVIKELCVMALRRKSMEPGKETTKMGLALLENLKGIFYYATPHQGSGFIDTVKFDDMEGELVGIVRIFNSELARLNEDFRNVQKQFEWDIANVIETLPTDLGGGLCHVIVPEGSARIENTIAVEEDHFSICQPRQKCNSTYKSLVAFIGKVLSEVVKEKCADVPGDWQILPKIQVGTTSSLAVDDTVRGLEKQSALGLWGMGGIGKTTLAKASFNALCKKFEYTLFAEDVKLIPGTFEALKKTLLKQMHHNGKKMEKMPDKTMLGNRKVLVVLDDVEKDRDIKIVSELQGICAPTSHFILTSRDREILRKVDDITIQEVKALEDEWAEKLFKWYAIPSGNLLSWQEKYVGGIVKHCHGLPLLLEVVGKYLKDDKKKDVWKAAVSALREADNVGRVGEVWSKLKISYDSLGDDEKQMFIEAATFFQEERRNDFDIEFSSVHRWQLREAKVAWNATYGITSAMHWRTLVDKSLVYDVEEDSEIKMHEHMRNLGQKLADDLREKGKILRIQDATSLLTALPEVYHKKVHTIQLHAESEQELCSRSLLRSLQAMENLQHLEIIYLRTSSSSDDDGEREEMEVIKLPCNLIVLRSWNLGANISFASGIKLAILILSVRDGVELLPDSFCLLHNLQVLYLDADSLQHLPEDFGSLKKLKTCKLLCGRLEDLPNSFGALCKLERLHLMSDIMWLPESFGSLGNLKCLTIGSNRLVALPESFGRLGNLEELCIESELLATLPESFGGLGNLKDLTIGSNRLAALPESFGRLGNLEELFIESELLATLPESFGGLGNLKCLTIGSNRLAALPESFGRLGNLEELCIESELLATLPESFGGLGNLKDLTIGSDRLAGVLRRAGKSKGFDNWK